MARHIIHGLLIGFGVALGLGCATPAFANMAACSSAYVKDSLEDKIRLYSLCLEGGLKRSERAGAHHNRGVAYMDIGQPDKALDDFNRSLEYDPDFGMGYFNRGIIYAQRSEFDLALEDFAQALKRPPARIRTSVYTQRGWVYAQMGDYANALADWDTAIEREKKYAPARLAKARVLATVPDPAFRDIAAAEAEARAVLALEDSWDAHIVLAEVLAADGRFEEAVEEHWLGMYMMQQDGLPEDPEMTARLARYQEGRAAQ